jgi:glycosyltransferase involved in cell wall biosynthesis
MNKPPSRPTKNAGNFFLPGCTRLRAHYEPQEIQQDFALRDDTGAAMLPMISIVVPSLNQGRFIGDTLESIVSQGYPNLELIVVDGGSSDDTVGVIKKYTDHIKWWVSEPDAGQANAVNKGMSRAGGEILAWLNSDDCLMPGALFRVAEYFQSSPQTDVIYGHRVLIDEAGYDVGRWIVPGHRKLILTYADYIPQETMFWRTTLWHKVGGVLDESFRFAMDWELIRRFIEADARFKIIPAFLGQFRLHDLQKSNAQIETDGFKEMEIIRQACRENFSGHPALQNLFYRVQRASLYSFVLRARIKELLWRINLTSID